MLKSSLKAPSSIDHDLFPLLMVRSCVSEADESKNGPRFCAEDKMTGAAYEIRSRKLELMREPADGDTQDQQDQHLLSASNLKKIRQQQARIDALLSAAAQSLALPSVALPIDMYIQEQPSTGDTYVASVDAFAGLSLGDIIRSGWGVMEEQVFLEILNAVESYGYASANLPPHGNLSSDAIKQLLIVRDGASEARQPSRWVVSDWLLLSEDDVLHDNATPGAFDVESFIGDIAWMLHSSFAQLRITTSSDGAYLSPAQVEDIINETVERIRTFLMQQAVENAVGAAAAMTTAMVAASSSTGEKGRNALINKYADESKKAVDEAASDLDMEKSSADEDQPDASVTVPNVDADAARPPTAIGLTGTPTRDNENENGSAQNRNHTQQLHDNAPNGSIVAAAKETARSMTLKDKMAYHQAALRNEQLLVNKHRRKNAPLPPRPTPMVNRGRKAAIALTPKSSVDEEDVYNDTPSMGAPIQVKPSAYLMQGRRISASGNGKSGSNSGRKVPSPRSPRVTSNESRTPRDGSKSTNTATMQSQPTTKQLSQQQQAATPRKYTVTPDDQRERLLDDVVNMAVMSQRRRGQWSKMQLEESRRRREQRQYVLAQSAPSGTAALRGLPHREMPAVLERPRVSLAVTSSNSISNVPEATMYEQQHGAINRRSSTLLTLGKDRNSVQTSTASPSADASASANPPGNLLVADEWPSNMSESPEPIPPSPHAHRLVHNYVAPPAAAAPHYRAPFDNHRARAGAAVAATIGSGVGQDRAAGRDRGVCGRRGIAVAPVMRPLKVTVGQKARVNTNVTGTGRVREVQAHKQAKTAVMPPRSARGAPPATSYSSVPRVVSTPGRTAGSGHPLSARAKKQAVAAPPVQAPVKEKTPVPSMPQLSLPSHDHSRPYVKPLPLANLSLRPHSAPVSAHVPTAEGSPRTGENTCEVRNAATIHNNASRHGASSLLSGELNALNSSRDFTRPPMLASPRGVVIQPSSGRGMPQVPNTTRPLPPQPALSPRGFRRIASTGVLSLRKTKNANARSDPRVVSHHFQSAAASHKPLSGRRGVADGDSAAPAKMVISTPPPLLEKAALECAGDKTLSAAIRKNMRRLVPDNVRAHRDVAEPLQQTPRTAPESVLATTQNHSAKFSKARNGAKPATSSNASRRKSALTLGHVRPVNESSPGILLRHRRRTAL